jgi:hypothetical protein
MPKFELIEYGNTVDVYHIEADSEEEAYERVVNAPEDYIIDEKSESDFWEIKTID